MASVHGGTIGRWFEKLCRTKHLKLAEIVYKNKQLSKNSLPKESGVYAFWWTGNFDLFSTRNRNIVLKGPRERPVKLLFDDDWLGTKAGYLYRDSIHLTLPPLAG